MAFVALTTPIVLPWPLQSGLEAAARALLKSGHLSHIDFSRPTGEAALVSPDSVSWRVFKNPLSLFIGGVTAVVMELAEPRVPTGVWEHTTFRQDPIRRLRRTGLARHGDDLRRPQRGKRRPRLRPRGIGLSMSRRKTRTRYRRVRASRLPVEKVQRTGLSVFSIM
jgi:hypothetical protein